MQDDSDSFSWPFLIMIHGFTILKFEDLAQHYLFLLVHLGLLGRRKEINNFPARPYVSPT